MGYPTVSLEETAKFARAWDKGGLKILLDSTSIQFAKDWADIALRSYVDDMVAKAKAKAAAAAKAKLEQEAPPAAPKSSIILTD